MLAVPAALSVSEQIKDVGAYAGLASILGLAVLSLLYFGQARELKRLRDWAGRAPERTAELQEQANAAAEAAAQRRGVAQPAAGRSPAQTPSTAAGAAGQAAPAAGAAAAAAARAQGAPSAAVGAPGAPAAAAARAPGAPSAAAGAPGTPAASSAAASGAPAPATGAPGALPGGQETQALPALTPDGAPAPPAPGGQAAPPQAPTPGAASAPSPGAQAPPTDEGPAPLRQVSAVGAAAPRRRVGSEALPPAEPERSRRSRGRTLGIIGGALAALLLVAVLATQLLGGNAKPTSTSARTASTNADNPFVPPATGATGATSPAVKPGDYSVFVLNATLQNGIAAEVAKTLETDGYRSAGTGNAAASNATTTEVFYLEGKKRAASAVAKKLGVAATSVKQADRGVAVQGPGADVIVQIGADKATP